MPAVVSHPHRAAPFYRAMNAQRVSIALLGASNVLQGGEGFDRGLHLAHAARHGMWGTGRDTQRKNGTTNAAGYLYKNAGTLFGGATGAGVYSTDFADPALHSSAVPHQYTFIDTPATAAGATVGFYLEIGCPINVAANLRCHCERGMFDHAEFGQWRDQVRLEASPWTVMHDRGVQSTYDDQGPHYINDSFDLGAGLLDPAKFYLWRSYRAGTGGDLVGPYWEGWRWVENRDRASGFSISVVATYAGASTKTLREQYILKPQASRAAHLMRVHLPANQAHEPASPRTIIMLRVDAGEKSDSNTNTPDGHAASLNALIDQIEADIAATGRPPEEFGIEVVTPHVQDATDEAVYAPIRARLVEVCATRGPRVWSVNHEGLPITHAEMLAAGYYSDGTHEHLSTAGYDAMGELEVAAKFAAVLRAGGSAASPARTMVLLE